MWEDDGSKMVKIVEGTAEFFIDGAPGGSPVNALFSRSLTSGQYFEVQVLKNDESTFVGVTTRESFAQGWKCHGLFFGGNLSDGGALVRSQFGEWPKTGMTVGVLTEITDEIVTVTFYQDGRCLGPAFKSKRLTKADIFPVVHTSGEGDRFVIRFPEEAPSVTTRQAKDGSSLHPAEGKWVLKRMLVGPELRELDWKTKMNGQNIYLEVSADTEQGSGPGGYRCFFKVVNNMWLSATAAADESLAPFERLTPLGGMASTEMYGLPGAMELEDLLSMNCESIFKWSATDGILKLVGQTIEMEFEPGSDDLDGIPATEVDLK